MLTALSLSCQCELDEGKKKLEHQREEVLVRRGNKNNNNKYYQIHEKIL